MRTLLLVLLTSFPAFLAADTLQLTLYAITDKDALRIPPEVSADAAKLAGHLEKLAAAGRAKTPVTVSEPINWGEESTVSVGEPFKYFQEFEEAKGKLVGKSEIARNLGYDAKWESTRGEGEAGAFDLTFSWTPTVDAVPIAGPKPVSWMPTFHTVSCRGRHTLLKNKPHLAATWRTNFALTEKDKSGAHHLYLLASWTDQPTGK